MRTAEIIEKYKNGVSLSALVRETHGSFYRLRRLLESHGLQIRDISGGKYAGWQNLRPLEEEEIKKLYLGGKSITHIAERSGIPRSRITRKLLNLKIRIRTPHEQLNLEYSRGRKKIEPPHPSGPESPSWKGGRKIHNGYVYLYAPDHHSAKRGYKQEHILVWEKVHQRHLPKDWIIHHLNGIKDDNRPENLEALSDLAHKRKLQIYQKRIRELEARIQQLENPPLPLEF